MYLFFHQVVPLLLLLPVVPDVVLPELAEELGNVSIILIVAAAAIVEVIVFLPERDGQVPVWKLNANFNSHIFMQRRLFLGPSSHLSG